MTQFFFLSLEVSEMKYSGFCAYFQDGWNYFDSTQPFFYLIRVCIRHHIFLEYRDHNGTKFWLEMVTIITVVMSAMKFLQLIRYNERFCYLACMLIQVVEDIKPFLVVLFTFSGIFMFVTIIIEGDYSQSTDYDYLAPYPFIIMAL